MPEIIIKPTIGRRVWFRPNLFDAALLGVWDTKQPLDAGVAYVWSDALVNLSVTSPDGRMHSRASVPLVQPGMTPPEGASYAEWMPYQIGQAPKSPPPVDNANVEPGAEFSAT